MKYCSKCKTTKSLDEFYKNAAAKDKVCAYCKPCTLASSTKYNKEHPKRRREYARQIMRYKRFTPSPGFVYLLHEKGSSYYKIGHTSNINARKRQIEGSNPHDLEVIHLVESSRANFLEVELHDLFDHKHHRLEWFWFEEEDVPFIKQAMEQGRYQQITLLPPKQTDFSLEESSRGALSTKKFYMRSTI